MKVGLFLGMYHIFLISRGLQKNSLFKLLFSKYTPLKCSLEIFTSVCCTSAIPYLALRNLSHGAMTTFFLEYAKGSFRKGFKSFKSSKHLLTTVKYQTLSSENFIWSFYLSYSFSCFESWVNGRSSTMEEKIQTLLSNRLFSLATNRTSWKNKKIKTKERSPKKSSSAN